MLEPLGAKYGVRLEGADVESPMVTLPLLRVLALVPIVNMPVELSPVEMMPSLTLIAVGSVASPQPLALTRTQTCRCSGRRS